MTVKLQKNLKKKELKILTNLTSTRSPELYQKFSESLTHLGSVIPLSLLSLFISNWGVYYFK